MKYLQEQRKRFRDGIKTFENGQKVLIKENVRIIEEERERDKLRSSKQTQVQVYDPFSYKDTETKTFYTGYIQQKYTNSETPFPERNTYTINVNNSHNNMNDYYSYGQYSSERNSNYNYNEVSSSICHDCGKFKNTNIQNGKFNYAQINNPCPNCGKAII